MIICRSARHPDGNQLPDLARPYRRLLAAIFKLLPVSWVDSIDLVAFTMKDVTSRPRVNGLAAERSHFYAGLSCSNS
jgi:hypothetical protein